MSASLRFLGAAVIAYVGLRAASSALALEPLPTITALPPPQSLPGEPLPGAGSQGAPQQLAAGSVAPPGALPPGYAYPVMMMPGAAGAPAYPPMVYAAMMQAAAAAMRGPRVQPIYLPMPYGAAPDVRPAILRTETEDALPPPRPSAFDPGNAAPPLDQWPAIGTTGPFSVSRLQAGPGPGDAPASAFKRSRWSLDAWALLRPPEERAYVLNNAANGLNPGLAPNGSLGGSQAGLRLTYRPFAGLGVHARVSSALLPRGRGKQAMSGGEAALGASWQPFAAIPLRLVGERRQRLGPAVGGGRNAAALFVEGGLYDRPLALGFRLDGYGQAGMVGARSRDLFADGALALSAPILPRLSLGGGLWGGVQPGLSRFDAGPRLSYQLGSRLRVHADYRFRVTGDAYPKSGPALTLAGGF